MSGNKKTYTASVDMNLTNKFIHSSYTAEEAAELLSDIINDPDSGDDCLATSDKEEDETSVEENEEECSHDFNEDYGN